MVQLVQIECLLDGAAQHGVFFAMFRVVFEEEERTPPFTTKVDGAITLAFTRHSRWHNSRIRAIHLWPRVHISAWLDSLSLRTAALGSEDCNLVAVWIPPAKHDPTAGAERGVDKLSTPDPHA